MRTWGGWGGGRVLKVYPVTFCRPSGMARSEEATFLMQSRRIPICENNHLGVGVGLSKGINGRQGESIEEGGKGNVSKLIKGKSVVKDRQRNGGSIFGRIVSASEESTGVKER